MAQISDYYRDKKLFITGVTGFVGKVLLEKLLRRCSSVRTVYCLVRPKGEETSEQRLANLLNHQCFDNLWREVSPLVRQKVRVVEGDIMEEGFGISKEMRQELEENVNVVFHLAATVKFNEPLRFCIEMNVRAVRYLVGVCGGMQHLESLLHVSTAFSNCEQSFISEQVYPSTVHPAKVLDLLDWLDEEAFNLITTKLLAEKPNTYVYSKHLAEVLLMMEGSHLPFSILRPSIITASWLDPFPGWVDSENGPSGLYVAMGRGLLRSMIADQCLVADVVPVDLAANMMVAVACYRATHMHDNAPQPLNQEVNFKYPPIGLGGEDGGEVGVGGKDGGGDGGCMVKGDVKLALQMNGEVDDGGCNNYNNFNNIHLNNNTDHNNIDQNSTDLNNIDHNNTDHNNTDHNNIDHNNTDHNNTDLNNNIDLDNHLLDRHSNHTSMPSAHNKHHNNTNSVYHLTTGGVNPFTWGEMENSVTTYFKKNPLDCCFRRPKSHVITSNSFLHDCWILVSHMMPAYATDLGYILIGQKPRMVQTYRRLHCMMEEMEYFTTRSCHWTHTHMDLVRGHMSAEDQKTFNFDPRVLHWPTYIENFCYGTKRFLLKEQSADLPAARKRLKMLRNIRYAFNTTLLVLAWRLLIAKSSLARNSWYLLLSMAFKFLTFFRLTSTLHK